MDDRTVKTERPALGTDASQPVETSAEAPAKKPYKSPTISRHGNLRLMTQLE